MNLLKPLLLVLVLTSCDFFDGTRDQRLLAEARDRAWNEPCADKSWLLATTAGSPDSASCPNKLHRMRVQVATTASHEEIGALVFCECHRHEDGGL
jgi:hypothetical protein